VTRDRWVEVVGAVQGVLSVETDTVKPGVARVRVVGGDVEEIVKTVNASKSAGVGVVVEHRASSDSPPTEIFL
jgi:hypothetical protein